MATKAPGVLPPLTRRQFGKLSAATLLLGPLANMPGLSLAANPTGKRLHGLSAFGDLKYGPDYTHFAYVNPEAPKGGVFNFSVSNWLFNQNAQTFDTLNTFVLKGNAPPKMEYCFDSLMIVSTLPNHGPIDEASAAYGMLAESVEISEDRNAYTFHLRPEAKFHDGSPVTADDVAFSYDLIKEKGHPDLALDLARLERVEVQGTQKLTLHFDGKQSDQLILGVAAYPVLSKAFYS